MTGPQYSARDLRAVQIVLTELRQTLGEYWQDNSLIVVGRSAPWLLAQDADPPHVGTLDLDLLLDPAKLGNGRYAEALRVLEDRGYTLPNNIDGERTAQRAFQLKKEIDLQDGGAPMPIVIDLMMPRGARYTRNRPALIPGLRVQEASGGAAALISHVEIVLEGQMPDGIENTIRVPVATPQALLVMKGYALDGRDKAKDAYDIVFLIRHTVNNGVNLPQDCAALIHDYLEALTAYQLIESKFRSRDAFGPARYAEFMAEEGLSEGQPIALLRRDAYELVWAWWEQLQMLLKG